MQKNNFEKTKDYIKLLPISLILLIVPTIVYMKKLKLDSVVASYWRGTTDETDFFSYHKMAWFIGLTCVAVIFSLFYIATKKIQIKFPKIFYPLIGYITLVFLSSSFSKFKSVAFYGFPDRYEGFFTILCYVLVCFICSIFICSVFDIKYLLSFLAVGVFIVSLIGITQFFNHDFLQTQFGKELFLPKASEDLAKSLSFKFPKTQIYSTLYNPNYVGGFFSIIMCICLVLYISTKKLSHKVISGVFSILSFINLLGSLSITGYISTVVAGLATLIFLRKQLLKNIVPLVTIVILLCATTFFMNYTSEGKVFKELGISQTASIGCLKDKAFAIADAIKSTYKASESKEDYALYKYELSGHELSNTVNTEFSTIAFKSTSKNYSNTAVHTGSENTLDIQSSAIVTDLKLNKNTISLYLSNNELLNIVFDTVNSELTFKDSSNTPAEINTETVDEKYSITFKDSRFNSLKISAKSNLVSVEAPNTSFNLAITKDGFKFINTSGQLTDITVAKSFGFEGREKWGSNRGYIWSRSIPLLKDTLLLGKGPDTFAIYFPQNDYVAKMKYMENLYTVVDKPHSIYLQMALNTGVLSLIAFLIFVGWYCIWSIKLYIKPASGDYFIPGVACLVSVISFLVSSIANDSTISVSPLFWILLGVGIACNRMYCSPLKPNQGKK